MKLTQLLTGLTTHAIPDCEVDGLENDSRNIKHKDLFFAYPGVQTDGRLYIRQAIEKGAAAVIYEPLHLPDIQWPEHAMCIPVANLADKLADIAQRFYHNPSDALQVIGVTGTNGKTTIAYQLAQAYDLLGNPAAYVGTIGEGRVNALHATQNTTPDALYLQKLLNEYRNHQLQTVAMEVSSHALSLDRVANVAFKQAIFTNLTLDHLDFHHTMEAYAQAKAKLFAYPALEYAIVNQDDPYADYMRQHLPKTCQALTIGLQAGCDITAKHWHTSMYGTEMEVSTPWGQGHCHTHMIGAFNIYNSLSVLASLLASGHALSDALTVLPQLKPAPGRLEVVLKAPCVIVDYAHTPDALKNVLCTLQQLKQGQLWVIFGCGGDRDTSKRPLMGEIASTYADKVVVTSDNPRSESMQAIIDDIKAGILPHCRPLVIADRQEAIETVLQLADSKDIVLIAGKGHEDYQIIGKERHYFSDQAVVKAWIKK